MTRRYWFPKPYADAVARLRVPFGFVMVAGFAWLAAPSRVSLVWGLPVAVVGLLLRAWAAGHLSKNQQLATSGPYGHVRNPLYIGTALVAAGLAIAAASWPLAVLFGGVFALVYLPVIELEEQHLRKLFPEYEEYAKRVPVLFPRIRSAGARDRFRAAVYRKNEEYQAALGFLAAVAWLLYRAWE